MGIESLIKKHALTKDEAERVRKVYMIGRDVVDMNVNELLTTEEFKARLMFLKGSSYSFKIMDTEEMKRWMNGWCYGFCLFGKKVIALHIDHVLHSSIADIADTILHECAHAVAFHRFGDSGHGKEWRYVSRLFGSTPKATTPMTHNLAAKVDDSKYKVVVLDGYRKKVELTGTAGRKLKNLHRRYPKGRPNLKGMLWLVKTEDYKRYGDSYEKLAKVAIR